MSIMAGMDYFLGTHPLYDQVKFLEQFQELSKEQVNGYSVASGRAPYLVCLVAYENYEVAYHVKDSRDHRIAIGPDFVPSVKRWFLLPHDWYLYPRPPIPETG